MSHSIFLIIITIINLDEKSEIKDIERERETKLQKQTTTILRILTRIFNFERVHVNYKL